MGSSKEKDREQKEREEEILWRTAVCTSFLLSFFFQFPASDSFSHHLHNLSVFPPFASLSGFLSVASLARFLSFFFHLSSKPEQRQEAAGAGRLWRGESQERILFHSC